MYTFAAAAAKSLQLCPTLCNPIDGSPPGSAISGSLQARVLKWFPLPSPHFCQKIKMKFIDMHSQGHIAKTDMYFHSVYFQNHLPLIPSCLTHLPSQIPQMLMCNKETCLLSVLALFRITHHPTFQLHCFLKTFIQHTCIVHLFYAN